MPQRPVELDMNLSQSEFTQKVFVVIFGSFMSVLTTHQWPHLKTRGFVLNDNQTIRLENHKFLNADWLVFHTFIIVCVFPKHRQLHCATKNFVTLFDKNFVQSWVIKLSACNHPIRSRRSIWQNFDVMRLHFVGFARLKPSPIDYQQFRWWTI